MTIRKPARRNSRIKARGAGAIGTATTGSRERRVVAQTPELAAYAGGRILENDIQRIRMISALGADAVRIEECLTDHINPELFRRVNVPLLQK